MEKGILLESGTNELEIIEFTIQDHRFGINVLKVREIIHPMPITKIPHAHHYILGIIQLRGEVLPVISLERALDIDTSNEHIGVNDKFVVTEFNQQKVVFHIHSVSKIMRISWEQIEKPAEIYTLDSSNIIGVIKDEDNMILLLDFEKIIVDINPDAGINSSKIKELGRRDRSEKQILVAEDSPLLRKLLKETLSAAGYDRVTFFENGREALDYMESIIQNGKDIYREIQLVITDIEMPQMDGHHFTRRIKDNPLTSKLPVIIFSSLITGDIFHKGEIVGAAAQITKPQINELVLKIDQNIL